MAGWIKMPLGMEVSLDPRDIVLDGDPAPRQKGAQQPPHFLADVYFAHTIFSVDTTLRFVAVTLLLLTDLEL